MSEADARIELYRNRKTEITHWLEEVKGVVDKWLEDSNSRVHFVRWRMKDEKSLAAKLARRDVDAQHDPSVAVTVDNFFSEINDLAGIRILALYRDDLPILDSMIRSEMRWKRNPWRRAYVEAGRSADRDWLVRHGFSDEEIEFRPGYSSIHYTIEPRENSDAPDPLEWKNCELQVRTIQQEALSEFSHQFKYPTHRLDPLANGLLVKLSHLVNLTEDISGEIRRYPANTLIAEELWHHARQTGSVDMESALRHLCEQIFPKASYLYRSAPFAIVSVLASTEREFSDFQLPSTTQRLVSLDFEDISNWFGDRSGNEAEILRQLYLEAHRSWNSQDPSKQITKYYVAEDEQIKPIKTDAYIDSVLEYMDVRVIPKSIFEEVHSQIRKKATAGMELKSYQFFFWTDKDGEFAKAASTQFEERELYGFYVPTINSDLLSGIVWLTNEGVEKHGAFRRYIRLLDELSAPDLGIVQTLKRGGELKAPNLDLDALRPSLESLVAEAWDNA